MPFTQIKGNEPIKRQLRAALSLQKLSNSILFSGPSGVGKALFAKELARHLLYPNGANEAALTKIANNNHLDLQILEPEGKSKMHSIASIREMIECLHLKPFEGAAKIFIILEAERMLPYSSNALLKTLEEPNFDSYLLLITSNISEMLPTIVSRVWRLNFELLKEEEILSFLKGRYQLLEDEYQKMARLAEGSIGRAVALIEGKLNERGALFIALIEEVAKANVEGVLDKISQIDNAASTDEEGVGAFYHEMEENILRWQRDLALLKAHGPIELLFFKEQAKLLQAQLALQKPYLTLEYLLEDMRFARLRNVKLRTTLEHFFLAFT